jgi:tRNA dimethylallyltransferase
MFKNGLLDEATALFPYRHLNPLNTVGYKELFEYIDGKYSLEMCIDKIKTHTRRYAKRQMTWFKKHDNYFYFDPSQYGDMIKLITS